MKHSIRMLTTIALGLLILSVQTLANTARNKDDTKVKVQAQAQIPLSKGVVEEWLQDLSNWGRWGSEDQLGTLNLITPEKRKQAAALVNEGIAVSLSLDIPKNAEQLQPNPYKPLKHKVYTGEHNGQLFAFDEYGIDYHGWGISHIDAPSHIFYRGKMYNGFSQYLVTLTDREKPEQPVGAKKLGVETMANGIVSRGVLIDIPRLMEVSYLAPGTAITVEDITRWEKQIGIRVESGDVVIVRTGRWRHWCERGTLEGLAGLHASVVKWAKNRDVAVLGSDGVNDVYPSGIPDMEFPLHLLALVGLGMPLIDNLDLERVADEAAMRNRWEFLFVASPLRVPGGTGSPINALAIF